MAAIPTPPATTLDTHASSNGPSPGFASGGSISGSARAASATPGVYGGAANPRKIDLRHEGRGSLRIVSNSQLTQFEEQSKSLAKEPEEVVTELAKYIRSRFEKAVRHRRTVAVDDELIRDMRAYNGQYEPTKLQEIRKMGGSEVYSRMMAMKCRGATALLRNVYMNSDRPWTLNPTPDPELPDGIDNHIKTLVATEVMAANKGGAMVEQEKIWERMDMLYEATKLAERNKAHEEAKEAQRKIDDILTEGQFYQALSDFLFDLPIYKYAVIKGPVTRRHTKIKWNRKGKAVAHEEAKFFWSRVSPWDVWFTPGATDITNTEVFERQRLSVQDLYDLLDLPGYRNETILEIIETYENRGFKEWIQIFDTERAMMEGRNNVLDDTFINAIEFNGFVLGKYLDEFGFEDIKEPLRPYFITAWMVDKKIFKVMMNPSPRQRVPYYITSFDKQPGTIYGGNGIPAMANDLTDVINATLRAMVNNLALASGPQVLVNRDLISPNDDGQVYPLKRWEVMLDPSIPDRKPVEFYQPQANSQELMGVIDKFSMLLDDVSTIPRYLTGSGASGGAGRTASGLSMLINNANKTLMNVADNIDRDIFDPLLTQLYDYIMLTDDTGMLRGDEMIDVDGVRQAAKQDSDMQRQLEFLQLIGNPQYQSLIGPDQTARILQAIADNLGLEVKINQPGDMPGAPPPGIPPQMMPAGGPPGAPPGAPQAASANPTGNQGPSPGPPSAPGAGGVPGLQPAPQVAPINTVNANV